MPAVLLKAEGVGRVLGSRWPAGSRAARRRVEVLRGVSLEVRRGRTLGIVGVSGAGKTTLGSVRVKLVFDGERFVRAVPEYEECRRIAGERAIPLLEVYERLWAILPQAFPSDPTP